MVSSSGPRFRFLHWSSPCVDSVLTGSDLTPSSWAATVFNVTDREGKKLRDEATVNAVSDFIRKVLLLHGGAAFPLT